MILSNVLNTQLPTIEQTINQKDCILYSLGIGLGSDPMDSKQLPFVYEDNLTVFPSQSVVIAHTGLWVADPKLEINWLKLLHGEQSITQHQPLKAGHTYIGNYRILGVIDKGIDKGALLYQEKTLTDKDSDELVSTVISSYFMRGDGGCGSSENFTAPQQVIMPTSESDNNVEYATAKNSALIYRLSGDLNPIHADPVKAKKAGFDRPILHGLCSFGVATRAIMDTYCDSDPQKLEYLGLRFSSPVYPGETIRVQLWQQQDNVINFSATVLERDVKVLDQGIARIKS